MWKLIWFRMIIIQSGTRTWLCIGNTCLKNIWLFHGRVKFARAEIFAFSHFNLQNSISQKILWKKIVTYKRIKNNIFNLWIFTVFNFLQKNIQYIGILFSHFVRKNENMQKFGMCIQQHLSERKEKSSQYRIGYYPD